MVVYEYALANKIFEEESGKICQKNHRGNNAKRGHVALTSFNCSKYCNLVFMSCQNDLFCPFLFYVFAAIWIFRFP